MMNLCSAETWPLPTFRAIGSIALAFGADHQPLDIGIGVILGLLPAEQGGEALVELDQSLGRGAHVVLGHGGRLQTGS